MCSTSALLSHPYFNSFTSPTLFNIMFAFTFSALLSKYQTRILLFVRRLYWLNTPMFFISKRSSAPLTPGDILGKVITKFKLFTEFWNLCL
jgi:hypothetical protein